MNKFVLFFCMAIVSLSILSFSYANVLFVWKTEQNFERKIECENVLMNILIAMPITYLGGLLSMVLILNISPLEAATMAVLPFVLGDVLKACAAAFIGVRINLALKWE